MKKQISLGLIAMVGILSTSMPFIAQASFTINTSKEKTIEYIYDAKPGEDIKDLVKVTNQSDEPVNLHLYGADGGTNDQGDFYAKTPNDQNFNIGKWVEFDGSTNITLKGKEERDINFDLQIPKTTPPGNYAGAIAVENVPDNAGQGMSLSTVSRVILPVKIILPGEKKHVFSLDDFSTTNDINTQKFSLKMSNQGNTDIIVEGNITITDPKNPDAKDPDNIITIDSTHLYSGDPINMSMDWKKHPVIGDYKATLNLTYSEFNVLKGQKENSQSLTKDVTFTFFPWGWVFTALEILAGLLVIFLAFLFWKNLEKKKATPYVVSENETIEMIAQKIKVSWKKIASMNNLKPPYTLHKGQTILIPKK